MPDETSLSFATPSDRFTGVNRSSGTLADRPNPKTAVGGLYFSTDEKVVYRSNGGEWLVRGDINPDDTAGTMSGLEADRPVAEKCIGWTYHTTDTGITYESFPSPDNDTGVWFTVDPQPTGLRPENLEDTVGKLKGPGFAKLRSLLTSPFGIRLQSTGDAPNVELTRTIMQTLDASPENPYLVTFNQFILDPFTGPGQFDLVERDSIRRVFDGASAGGTAILTSATMNWQPGDADKLIQVGTDRWYKIVSRQSSTQVTLSDNIILPSINLRLTMNGETEATIATKSGFSNGAIPVGGWSRIVIPITVDKVYSVVFVPGDAGDGIYSIDVKALYPVPPDQTPVSS